jgi:predicted membrane GTPase involved in stress response
MSVDNLDWVTARHACSVEEVFERLKAEVQEDVKTREALRPRTEDHSHYAFRFRGGPRWFAAFMDGKNKRGVQFKLEHPRIVVTKADGSFQEATVALNNEGRCVLKVGDTAYESWQFRKLVLEDLFFE